YSPSPSSTFPLSLHDALPIFFHHGVVGEAPLVHFSQCERHNILKPESDYECRMTESFHLINLERQPKSERCDLDTRADNDQNNSEYPNRFPELRAIPQQQRHRNEARQFGCSGNITIPPGEVATPDGIFRIKSYVAQKQQECREHISL